MVLCKYDETGADGYCVLEKWQALTEVRCKSNRHAEFPKLGMT